MATVTHIEFVEREIRSLRRKVRVWVAATNADAGMFGGSSYLHGHAVNSMVDSILMQIRKLLDAGRRSKDGSPNEADLFSLYRALEEVGAKALADNLRRDAVQLRLVADKTVAHAKPRDVEVERIGRDGRQLTGGEFQPVMVFEIVDAMTRAYATHIVPGSDLDSYVQYQDPLFRMMPTRGLPVIDYDPGDPFAQSYVRPPPPPPPMRAAP